MKITTAFMACFFAFTLTAADRPNPARFEVRLVLEQATGDSEQLTMIHQGTAPERTSEEKLHVQKKPLLNRSDLSSAALQKNRVTGSQEIQLTFTDQGAKRFAEVTREHIGQRLAVVIDNKIYSAPKVMTEVPGGTAVISGSFSAQEAKQLVNKLNESGKK